MSTQASNIAVRLLALIALCVQLAVSFGHVHFDADHDVVGASGQYLGADPDHCPLPAHDEDEHDCPICQAMSLAGSAVVPLSPEIALPVLFEVKPEPLRLVQIAVSETARNFQARAPPRL